MDEPEIGPRAGMSARWIVERHFFFFVASVMAGTVNALAGGSGLITFPLEASR